MKHLLPVLLFLASVALSAAAPAAPQSNTNETVILSDGGVEYETAKAVYRINVRVFDPKMDLFCELLNVFFQTNSHQFDTIIAETNVVIFQENLWAISDKAVYTATNDTVVLSGNVLVDTPQGYLMAPTVILNRKTNKMSAPGPVTMGIHPGTGMFGTNALGIALPGIRPPPQKPATGPK